MSISVYQCHHSIKLNVDNEYLTAHSMRVSPESFDITSIGVNKIAREHNIPPYVAAFRIFNEIRDYNKIGGLKKEVSALYLRKLALNQACSSQSESLITLA